MKKNSKVFILIGMFVILSFSFVLATTVNDFQGNITKITQEGEDYLGVGKTVLLYLDGNLKDSFNIAENGFYYLVAQGSAEDEGKRITFKIDNYYADQNLSYVYRGEGTSPYETILNLTITDYDGDGYSLGYEGYEGNLKDCNDSDPNINPGAEEIADELDNNCNGEIDENLEENETLATEQNTTIDRNTTTLIFNSASSSVEKVTINSSIDGTKAIELDMSALLSGSNVSVSGNLVLERQTVSRNYTVTIFNGTVIEGQSAWDGTFQMPTVTTLTTNLGTVEAVIKIGDSSRLDFSKAVKIVIDGMTGKKALWSDSSGSYAISACSDSNDTTAGSLISGECFYDDGNNLIIWTYHFTEFGAYTPTTTTTTTTSSGGGGGGSSSTVKCTEDWTCSDWSTCQTDGTQLRVCTDLNDCKTIDSKPEVIQNCIYNSSQNTAGNTNEVEATQETSPSEGFLTGFSIFGNNGTLNSQGLGILIILIVLIIGFINHNKFKKNKSLKTKKKK